MRKKITILASTGIAPGPADGNAEQRQFDRRIDGRRAGANGSAPARFFKGNLWA